MDFSGHFGPQFLENRPPNSPKNIRTRNPVRLLFSKQRLKPTNISAFSRSFVGSATNRGRLTIKTKVEEWSNRTHKAGIIPVGCSKFHLSAPGNVGELETSAELERHLADPWQAVGFIFRTGPE